MLIVILYYFWFYIVYFWFWFYIVLLCFIPLEMHVRLICAIKFYLLSYLLTYLLTKIPKIVFGTHIDFGSLSGEAAITAFGSCLLLNRDTFCFFICECSKKFSASTCMCIQNHSALIEFNHDIILFFLQFRFQKSKEIYRDGNWSSIQDCSAEQGLTNS